MLTTWRMAYLQEKMEYKFNYLAHLVEGLCTTLEIPKEKMTELNEAAKKYADKQSTHPDSNEVGSTEADTLGRGKPRMLCASVDPKTGLTCEFDHEHEGKLHSNDSHAWRDDGQPMNNEQEGGI